MSFNKLHVSSKTTAYFSQLKGRTGLTPNILSRMALCLSIADLALPNTKLDDEKGQEFSRYTLLGEWDTFFISLLRERLIHDGLDPEEDLMAQFKGHLNRGVLMLYSRVKSLDDINDLIVQANSNINTSSNTEEEEDVEKVVQKIRGKFHHDNHHPPPKDDHHLDSAIENNDDDNNKK
jgi:DNA sulfur modification protein DndE